MQGKLTFISTPIGNMADISLRALEEIKKADVVLCEDTRHSGKLLSYYEIKKPLMSYHKFNMAETTPKIIKMLKNGKNVALMSDAGMPGISDPGSELAVHLQQNEIDYTVVPGANAALCALLLSGFDSSSFTFLGFLPEKKVNQFLEEYKNIKSTLIFYSGVHDVNDDLQTLFNVFGNRRVAIVREITKLHEECIISELEKPYTGVLKGEFVLVVEGNKKEIEEFNFSIEEHVKMYIDSGLSKNDAIKQVALARKMQKREVYNTVVKNDD